MTPELKQLAIDALEYHMAQTRPIQKTIDALAALRLEPVSEPNTHGCACRWDANDNRVATCVRHQGWLDVVHEWADRAKAAEKALAAQQSAEPVSEQCTNDEWLANCPQEARDFAEKIKAELSAAPQGAVPLT